MKKILGTLMVMVLLAGILSGCGGENSAGGSDGSDGVTSSVTIKIANIYGEDMTETKSMYEFKKLLEEKSGGSIKVEVYPNCQLGAADVLADGLRQGTIEMVIGGSEFSSYMPFIDLSEFPFLFRDWDHANKALHDPEVVEKLCQGANDAGLVTFGLCPSGFRCVSSNTPYYSLDEMRQMRLRIPNIPLYVKTFENMGINAVALPMTELFTALEQHVADGQEVSPSICLANKFYEVQSAYIITNHMFTCHCWYMNQKFFDGLSAEQQALVQECAEAAIAYDWSIAEDSEKNTITFFEEQGLEIIYPDEAFRSAMEDTQSATLDWAEERTPGARELIERIKAIS